MLKWKLEINENNLVDIYQEVTQTENLLSYICHIPMKESCIKDPCMCLVCLHVSHQSMIELLDAHIPVSNAHS